MRASRWWARTPHATSPRRRSSEDAAARRQQPWRSPCGTTSFRRGFGDGPQRVSSCDKHRRDAESTSRSKAGDVENAGRGGRPRGARDRVIGVDASALLEFLLQTPLGTRVEARLFRNHDDFHRVGMHHRERRFADPANGREGDRVVNVTRVTIGGEPAGAVSEMASALIAVWLRTLSPRRRHRVPNQRAAFAIAEQYLAAVRISPGAPLGRSSR